MLSFFGVATLMAQDQDKTDAQQSKQCCPDGQKVECTPEQKATCCPEGAKESPACCPSKDAKSSDQNKDDSGI